MESATRYGTFSMASDPKRHFPIVLDAQEMASGSPFIERRRRTRAQVHWPVYFSLRGSSDLVRTTTEDLSSQGFYCVANGGFVPGEIRECTLLVPTHDLNGGSPTLPVMCRVRVVRVESLGERGACGVGFAIEDYRFAGLVAEESVPQ